VPAAIADIVQHDVSLEPIRLVSIRVSLHFEGETGEFPHGLLRQDRCMRCTPQPQGQALCQVRLPFKKMREAQMATLGTLKSSKNTLM
jgi:hypothetical protein